MLSHAVVIPAHDSEGTIGEVVRALRADSPGSDVLVVDDGSRDATAARAESAGARVLRLPERGGPARARNRGVAASAGEAVVFLDADCVPLPGLVSRLLEPLERDATVTATKGAYVTAQRGLVARFVQLEYEERYARMARRAEIDFVDTYACAYRRDAFLSVGGFDERYDRPSTEDQELSFRLHERGARFLFVRDALVRHTHAASLAGYFRKKAKIGHWKAATLRAHPKKAIDDAHTPPGLKAQLALAPLALLGAGALAFVIGVEVLHGWGSYSLRWVPSALRLDLEVPWIALSLASVVVFSLTTLPLFARALKKDPVVAPFVPLLSLVRAIALGLGLASGIVREAALGGVLKGAAPVKEDEPSREKAPGGAA
ncbi:glycosyltransferase [bacterium]|nr:glycosyltransferase [bacterium]